MYTVHQGNYPLVSSRCYRKRTWRTKLRNSVRPQYQTITTLQRPTVLQGHKWGMVLNHSVVESSSKGKQGSGQGSNNCAENIDELLEG